MILCVCPNPSIDAYAHLSNFEFGKANRISKMMQYPGGKGIHVALALRELGADVALMGMWAGATGAWIKKECQQQNIDCFGIALEGANRKCLTILSEDISLNNTELLEPGPECKTNQWQEFLTLFGEKAASADLICISGSLPSGSPKDGYAKMASVCKNLGKKCILDCSGDQLRACLDVGFFGLHINEHEANDLFPHLTVEEVSLVLRKNIDLVAVTAGKKGLYMHYHQDEIHAAVSLEKVISTVGSGDCLTAGLAYGVQQNLENHQLAALGVACGAANCLREDLGMMYQKDVMDLLERVEVKIKAHAA